jgi:hypothetical protein
MADNPRLIRRIYSGPQFLRDEAPLPDWVHIDPAIRVLSRVRWPIWWSGFLCGSLFGAAVCGGMFAAVLGCMVAGSGWP